MLAQSGHEQLSAISWGEGKIPSPLRVTISITPLEIEPLSSSTSDSIWPAQRRLMSVQRGLAIGLIWMWVIWDVPWFL
jgi:hypothetical protein